MRLGYSPSRKVNIAHLFEKYSKNSSLACINQKVWQRSDKQNWDPKINIWNNRNKENEKNLSHSPRSLLPVLHQTQWVGGGVSFLGWWSPSTMWACPLCFLVPPPGMKIPSFQTGGHVLHVEHISCVITNCGQHQWTIPSLFFITP